MKTTQRRLLVFAKSFGFLFLIVLIASFALFYFVMSSFRGVIFGPDDAPIWVRLPFRGVNFRDIIEAPIPYLLSISLVASMIGAFWSSFVFPKFPRFIPAQILIIPWIAVVLTGPIWGLIWSVNHWPAEGFTNYETMMLFRRTDIENGLYLSWLSAVQSYPLNIFSYLVYCGLLLINKRFLLSNEESAR